MRPWHLADFSRSAVILCLALVLDGCAVANKAIRSDFTDFNNIIQYNQTQQMLLNLVRMHFREAPLFLQPGSLTASYESHAGASLDWIMAFPGSSDSGEAVLDYFFSTKPTVSYTPVEGKNYAQQFLAEVSPDTFCLLLRSGWPISELVNVLVERVTPPGSGTLVNDTAAASDPVFTAFVASLQEAQSNEQLSVVTRNESLALALGDRIVPLNAFQFRSLFDVLFAASGNTQTPPEQAGRVKAGRGNGVLDIRVSKSPPEDSMVWVKYAGYHYSISHEDIRSKDTLALFMQLYRIQAAPSGAVPVLTIPAR